MNLKFDLHLLKLSLRRKRECTFGCSKLGFVKIAFWEAGDYGHHCTVVPVICLPSRVACSMAWFVSISFASSVQRISPWKAERQF